MPWKTAARSAAKTNWRSEMPSISRTATARITGSRSRALVLATAACLLALALSPAVVSAAGGRDSRNAENTFTKYISTYPVMAGVVGGDVGVGTYAGAILSLDVTNTGLVTDDVYDFDGSTAVITGRVTGGWLKGNQVSGQYTQVTCEQTPGVFGTCFQGTLDVLRGTKPGS